MSTENKPLEAPTDAATISIKKMLDAQEKVRVQLHQQKPPQPRLPDKTVQINGYTYQIMRGKTVLVPTSVYEILVQAGEVAAMNDEDEVWAPTVSAQPLAA